MIKQTVFITWLWLLITSYSFAASYNYTWKIEDLARTNAANIKLRDKNNRFLKKIDAKQMVYLYSVMKAIEDVSEVHAELLIVDGEHPNAFASKGMAELVPVKANEKDTDEPNAEEVSIQGNAVANKKPIDKKNAVKINIVKINFAMLDLLRLDIHMAAALIGHELAHLKLNHGDERKDKPRSNKLNVTITRYSRDNEREADYLGAIWAVEAGYDPHGAVRLRELLYKTRKHLSGGYTGTHPSSIERMSRMKSLARRLSQ